MRKYSERDKELLGEFFLDLDILTPEEIEKILAWQESRMCCNAVIAAESGIKLSSREIRMFSKEHRN